MEQQKTVALSTAEAEYLALYVQLSVGAVLVVVSLSSVPQFCYFICSILLSLVYIANYYISNQLKLILLSLVYIANYYISRR